METNQATAVAKIKDYLPNTCGDRNVVPAREVGDLLLDLLILLESDPVGGSN